MPKFRVKATIIDEALMKWVRPLSTLANVGLGAYILFNEVTFLLRFVSNRISRGRSNDIDKINAKVSILDNYY
jgi:hypothetical protein